MERSDLHSAGGSIFNLQFRLVRVIILINFHARFRYQSKVQGLKHNQLRAFAQNIPVRRIIESCCIQVKDKFRKINNLVDYTVVIASTARK